MDPEFARLRSDRDHRARELRREMSNTERRLWYRLRARQVGGRKFRRQVPLGPYFADFACLNPRVVVEVDGEHHGDQLAYDRRRDRLMASMGYRVLRFWVNEIDDSMEAVLEAIHQAVMAPSSRESTSSGEP